MEIVMLAVIVLRVLKLQRALSVPAEPISALLALNH